MFMRSAMEIKQLSCSFRNYAGYEFSVLDTILNNSLVSIFPEMYLYDKWLTNKLDNALFLLESQDKNTLLII